MSDMTSLSNVFFGGVDLNQVENGGAECAAHASGARFWLEFIFFNVASIAVLLYNQRILNRRKPEILRPEHPDAHTIRAVISVLSALCFGIEIGFKFSTKQLIFILNPCHFCVVLQLMMLCMPAGRWRMNMFRWHMSAVVPAALALALPATRLRVLPFETAIYYIEHVIIIFTAYILPQTGGDFTPEKSSEFKWTVQGCALNVAYHFGFLYPLALLSDVNLSNMLCPHLIPTWLHTSNYRITVCLIHLMLVPIFIKALLWFSEQSPIILIHKGEEKIKQIKTELKNKLK